MTDYRATGGGYPPDYEDKDPRSWRNECEDRTLKLADFLDEWKENHQTLTWIGQTLGRPEIWWIDYRSDPEKTRNFRVCLSWLFCVKHSSVLIGSDLYGN